MLSGVCWKSSRRRAWLGLGLGSWLIARGVPTAAALEPAAGGADRASAPPCLTEAAARETDSSQLLELALSCYESEQYASSLALLERLRSVDPNPVVLFNLGAAHAALGQCGAARQHYDAYLQQTQSETGKADAREQLARLRDCVEAPGADEPPRSASTDGAETSPLPSTKSLPSAHAGAAPPPAAMVVRPPRPVTEGPSYQDLAMTAPEPPSRAATWVLLGGSAALLLASGSFAYASERTERSEAERGLPSGDDIARSEEDGRRYNTLAWACAGGALALASSGLILLAFEPKSDASASLPKSPRVGGLSVRLQHRF